MFWTILLYVTLGLLILHLVRIKKADEKNPNLSLGKIIYMYYCTDRFEIFISLIGLIVFTNLLNLGLGEVLAKFILGYGDLIDTKTPWGIRGIAFVTGITMQWVIMWFAKRKPNSLERILQKKEEADKTNSDNSKTPQP